VATPIAKNKGRGEKEPLFLSPLHINLEKKKRWGEGGSRLFCSVAQYSAIQKGGEAWGKNLTHKEKKKKGKKKEKVNVVHPPSTCARKRKGKGVEEGGGGSDHLSWVEGVPLPPPSTRGVVPRLFPSLSPLKVEKRMPRPLLPSFTKEKEISMHLFLFSTGKGNLGKK